MMPDQVLQMAELCAQSYHDIPDYGGDDGACRAHVYGTALIFEGTSDLESVMADAEVDTIRTPSFGRVHEGFWSSLETLLPKLLQLNITAVGGHSLGAAHAMFFSAVCATQGRILSTFCYEPPRISADHGLQAFVENFKIPVYACRNGNDVVTELPSWMYFPVPLTKIGTPQFPIDNLSDHSIDAVVSALKGTK